MTETFTESATVGVGPEEAFARLAIIRAANGRVAVLTAHDDYQIHQIPATLDQAGTIFDRCSFIVCDD